MIAQYLALISGRLQIEQAEKLLEEPSSAFDADQVRSLYKPAQMTQIGIYICMVISTLVSLIWKPRAYKLYYFLFLALMAVRYTIPSDFGTRWSRSVTQEIWLLFIMFSSGKFWSELIFSLVALAYLNLYV